jgi:FkbM family methyltransferase
MFETYVRDEYIDWVTGWVWPKEDSGLWAGPSQEWGQISEMIRNHCKTKIVAVQAGGACGMYPRLMSQIFEQVYTFEPDQYNFYCLAQNCQNPNIHKFNCALGDRHTNITFNQPTPQNRGEGRIDAASETAFGGTIPMLMVDDFEYQKLDLIHLDVEGSEYFVLKGAEKSIEKHRPLIILETVNEEIREILNKYGYEEISKAGYDTVFKFTPK